jgi:hypothetical protein
MESLEGPPSVDGTVDFTAAKSMLLDATVSIARHGSSPFDVQQGALAKTASWMTKVSIVHCRVA